MHVFQKELKSQVFPAILPSVERKALKDLLDHEVRQIPEFPSYAVSFSGEVFRIAKANRDYVPLQQNINQRGIAHVGLYENGRLFRRSVAHLVADAFLEPPPFEHYDTLIHLDADKTNAHAENLAWRPRWFSFEYHAQYAADPAWAAFPVEVKRTGEWFNHSYDFCMHYGALVRHVINALMHNSPVPLLWIEIQSPVFLGDLRT